MGEDNKSSVLDSLRSDGWSVEQSNISPSVFMTHIFRGREASTLTQEHARTRKYEYKYN